MSEIRLAVHPTWGGRDGVDGKADLPGDRGEPASEGGDIRLATLGGPPHPLTPAPPDPPEGLPYHPKGVGFPTILFSPFEVAHF